MNAVWPKNCLKVIPVSFFFLAQLALLLALGFMK